MSTARGVQGVGHSLQSQPTTCKGSSSSTQHPLKTAVLGSTPNTSPPPRPGGKIVGQMDHPQHATLNCQTTTCECEAAERQVRYLVGDTHCLLHHLHTLSSHRHCLQSRRSTHPLQALTNNCLVIPITLLEIRPSWSTWSRPPSHIDSFHLCWLVFRPRSPLTVRRQLCCPLSPRFFDKDYS